jgi:hypothetical protein
MNLFADNFVAPLSAVLICRNANSAPRKAARRVLGENLRFHASSFNLLMGAS